MSVLNGIQGTDWGPLFLCLLGLIPCAIEDAKTKKISFVRLMLFLLLGIATGTARIAFGKPDTVRIFAGLLPGTCLMALSLLTPESIGFGDGLAILGIGMLLGFGQTILLLGIALSLAWIRAVVLFAAGKVGRGKTFAFLPFLLAAGTAVFAGEFTASVIFGR